MKIAKVENVKDYWGRKAWRIYSPDGRWIEFLECAGWTEEEAKNVFVKNFEYWWNEDDGEFKTWLEEE